MFVLKRIATTIAVVLAAVLLLEHGCSLAVESGVVMTALAWTMRVAVAVAVVWVWVVCSRGASSASAHASFSGGEFRCVEPDVDELS